MSEKQKNIIYGYFSKFVSLISGIILSVILVKYLSVKEFGEYRFLGSFITILSIISSFGLEGVMQRYTREFLDRGKYGILNRFIVSVVILRILILVVLSFILLFLFDDLKIYFNLTIDYFYFFIVLLIFMLIRIKSLIGTAFVTAYLEVYQDNLNFIFSQLIKLILLIYVSIHGYGLKGIILSWLFVEFVSVSHFFIIFIKKIIDNRQKSFSYRMNYHDKARILKFGKYQTFSIILFSFADIAIDNMMIGYYLGQEEVAFYTFGLGLLTILSNINPLTIFRGLISTLFTKSYINTKSLTDLKDKFILISKLIMAIMIPSYLIFAINIKNIIIFVYDDKYLESINIIYVGILFFIFRELTLAFNPLINTLEKNNLFLYTGVFSIFNLIGNIMLIPNIGILGAILSTGSAIIMIFYFYLYQFKKIFGKEYYPWKDFFIIIMYNIPVIIFHILTYKYISSILFLIIIILIEIILVYLIYVKFKIFTEYERNRLNSYINKEIIKF